MKTNNLCKKCGRFYLVDSSTSPCGKCGGETRIEKSDHPFYAYDEVCQKKKCMRRLRLGVSLKMNQEEDYGDDPKMETKEDYICSLC